MDRHLEEKSSKAAIVSELENGETKTLTYSELHKEVCRFANALKELEKRGVDFEVDGEMAVNVAMNSDLMNV